MAAGDIRWTAGTPLSWLASGGTYAFTFTSIANGNARTGGKGELGLSRAEWWRLLAQIQVGATGPAEGESYDIFWCSSDSATPATNNEGRNGLFTGVDATVTAPAENDFQGLTRVGSIVCRTTADAIYRKNFLFRPPTRYGFPVVVNRTSQTSGATAGNHQIILTPLEESVAQA